MLEAIGNWLSYIFSWWGDFFGKAGNGIVQLINGILDGVSNLISQFLSSIGLNFTIPQNIYMVLDDITRGIGYILPINKLIPLVVFALAYYVGSIIMSVYNKTAHTVVTKTKVRIP